jgi:hypothetical protein
MTDVFDVTGKKLLVAKRFDAQTFMVDLKLADEDGNTIILRLSPEQLEEVQQEIAPKPFQKKVVEQLSEQKTDSVHVALYGIIVAQVIAFVYIMFFM